MDIDETGCGTNSISDLEQSFLRQFSCLGTNDKNELINQFLELIKFKLDHGKAQFYLEMSDWNLQLAVCNYFDMETYPSVRVIDNPIAGENGNVPVNTTFTKKWRLKNVDNLRLPSGLLLVHVFGDCRPLSYSYPIPELLPSHEYEVSVEVQSPNTPGFYSDIFRIKTSDGIFLTTKFILEVNVMDVETFQLNHQMSQFHALGQNIENQGIHPAYINHAPEGSDLTAHVQILPQEPPIPPTTSLEPTLDADIHMC